MSRRKNKRNRKEIAKQIQCSPRCNYFPNMECYHYDIDESGLKRRADKKKFICAFDGHEIKSWYDKCPLK